MGEHAMVEHAGDTTTPNDHAGPPHVDGGGVGELRAMLASSRPSPQQVAEIVKRHPQEQGAMFAMLHGMLGNAFVSQVLEATTATVDVMAIGNAQVTATPAPAPTPTPDPDVELLLKWAPTTARGERGTAAWLLRAAELGFLTIDVAQRQLEAFRNDAPRIHSVEDHVSDAADTKDRTDHPGRFDHITKNPAGGYDLQLQDASILATLVTVATTRIKTWRSAGGKKPTVLALGQFVRADIGFGGNVNSPHKDGKAMDLRLQKSSTNDAIELLRDLPPGELRVFIDNPNALHLNTTSTGFELGIPAGSDYVPAELAMDGPPNYRNRAQDRLEREAGEQKTLRTRAINTHDGSIWNATATRNDTGWKWTPWTRDYVSAESLITSTALTRAIADYRTRSRAATRVP